MNNHSLTPNEIFCDASRIEHEIISWRRHLHSIPEIELNLPQTANFIAKQLESMDIPVKRYLCGNALVGMIKNPCYENTRTVGLRADMDALPIREETNLPFASINGAMHACGHDGHMSMLLGAAHILSQHRKQLSRDIALIFQPGEEFPGGAYPMIKEGVLNDNQIDVIAGIHAGNMAPDTEHGSFCWIDGAMMASMDRFLIKVNGKGAHGAYPELANDPIIAASQIVTALQTIRSRNLSGIEPAVLSVTRISGGYNQNIIPDNTEIEGTVRAFAENTQKKIAVQIEMIASGTAEALGCQAEISYNFCYPPLINHSECTITASRVLTELFGERVVKLTRPSLGGEDFAFYLKEIPGVFLFLTNPRPINGKIYPHHTSKFDLDESLLKDGVAALVQLALHL